MLGSTEAAEGLKIMGCLFLLLFYFLYSAKSGGGDMAPLAPLPPLPPVVLKYHVLPAEVMDIGRFQLVNIYKGCYRSHDLL